MHHHFYATTPSPLGLLILTGSEEGLTGLYLPEHAAYIQAQDGIQDSSRFKQACTQLDEYFAGTRTAFDLPLAPVGTPFELSVWKKLAHIPYGNTVSYKSVAEILNRPTASRAVGRANSQNPISIIVPCHRVVGTDGTVRGYAGGLKARSWLLDHETRYR